MTRALSILIACCLLVTIVALAGDRIYLVVPGVNFTEPDSPRALFDANNEAVYDAGGNRVYKPYP